ncbi:hypothetical protein [Blattabacterium cuenoti]|uniref:hypothetical protein n=1 Tax=Blattabacterium cuenoti TaxID=1653831 RepID=UPI00163CF753|nr:hypothetical protein [Blattabacterium cuenoti]
MSKFSKIVLFLLIFFASFLFFLNKNYLLGTFLLLFSLIPIFFIFRNEFLLLAFLKVNKKDMNGLEKYLGYVKNPKSQLTKNQMAYYYFLNGILHSEKNILKSENYMQKALDFGLKFKQNIAIAKLNLAIASLSKGDKKKANILLLEAKKIDTYGLLHNQIKVIKIQMKKMNMGNRNQQNPYIRKS